MVRSAIHHPRLLLVLAAATKPKRVTSPTPQGKLECWTGVSWRKLRGTAWPRSGGSTGSIRMLNVGVLDQGDRTPVPGWRKWDSRYIVTSRNKTECCRSATLRLTQIPNTKRPRHNHPTKRNTKQDMWTSIPYWLQCKYPLQHSIKRLSSAFTLVSRPTNYICSPKNENNIIRGMPRPQQIRTRT